MTGIYLSNPPFGWTCAMVAKREFGYLVFLEMGLERIKQCERSECGGCRRVWLTTR